MKRFRPVIYFLCAFVLAGGISLTFVQRAGLFEVGSVPVEIVAGSGDAGRNRGSAASEARLKERLQASLKSLAGKKIWQIDLTEVKASLVRDEWVRDVLISRQLPNELKVRVRPKAAALVMLDKQGMFIPVTDEGDRLSPLATATLPDVPLLRGEVFEREPARLAKAVRFAMALSEKGPMSRRNVSEITWTPHDGFVLTLMQPQIEVKLGEDRVELKALRVAQVLSYMSVNSLKGRVIDASFSKKVLVRLRKAP